MYILIAARHRSKISRVAYSENLKRKAAAKAKEERQRRRCGMAARYKA